MVELVWNNTAAATTPPHLSGSSSKLFFNWITMFRFAHSINQKIMFVRVMQNSTTVNIRKLNRNACSSGLVYTDKTQLPMHGSARQRGKTVRGVHTTYMLRELQDILIIDIISDKIFMFDILVADSGSICVSTQLPIRLLVCDKHACNFVGFFPIYRHRHAQA